MPLEISFNLEDRLALNAIKHYIPTLQDEGSWHKDYLAYSEYLCEHSAKGDLARNLFALPGFTYNSKQLSKPLVRKKYKAAKGLEDDQLLDQLKQDLQQAPFKIPNDALYHAIIVLKNQKIGSSYVVKHLMDNFFLVVGDFLLMGYTASEHSSRQNGLHILSDGAGKLFLREEYYIGTLLDKKNASDTYFEIKNDNELAVYGILEYELCYKDNQVFFKINQCKLRVENEKNNPVQHQQMKNLFDIWNNYLHIRKHPAEPINFNKLQIDKEIFGLEAQEPISIQILGLLVNDAKVMQHHANLILTEMQGAKGLLEHHDTLQGKFYRFATLDASSTLIELINRYKPKTVDISGPAFESLTELDISSVDSIYTFVMVTRNLPKLAQLQDTKSKCSIAAIDYTGAPLEYAKTSLSGIAFSVQLPISAMVNAVSFLGQNKFFLNPALGAVTTPLSPEQLRAIENLASFSTIDEEDVKACFTAIGVNSKDLDIELFVRYNLIAYRLRELCSYFFEIHVGDIIARCSQILKYINDNELSIVNLLDCKLPAKITQKHEYIMLRLLAQKLKLLQAAIQQNKLLPNGFLNELTFAFALPTDLPKLTQQEVADVAERILLKGIITNQAVMELERLLQGHKDFADILNQRLQVLQKLFDDSAFKDNDQVALPKSLASYQKYDAPLPAVFSEITHRQEQLSTSTVIEEYTVSYGWKFLSSRQEQIIFDGPGNRIIVSGSKKSNDLTINTFWYATMIAFSKGWFDLKLGAKEQELYAMCLPILNFWLTAIIKKETLKDSFFSEQQTFFNDPKVESARRLLVQAEVIKKLSF